MNYPEYRDLFDKILTAPEKTNYNTEDFIEYVRLNIARHDRWVKTGIVSEPLKQFIQNEIKEAQSWVLITEPWCGDASHITPFIEKMASLNGLVSLKIQLRDEESEIDTYLTNGGKSIPILIVRDAQGNDLFVWGPRPKSAQDVHLKNLNTDKTAQEKKIELQNWYNSDKGQTMQDELLQLFKESLIPSNH